MVYYYKESTTFLLINFEMVFKKACSVSSHIVQFWDVAEVKFNGQTRIPNQTNAKDTDLIYFLDVNLLPVTKSKEHEMVTRRNRMTQVSA